MTLRSVLLSGLCALGIAYGLSSLRHVEGAGLPPDAGIAVVAPPPSASLADPVAEPAEAWSDAVAARKVGWPALVFASVTMLAIGAGTLGRRVGWLAWLGRGTAATALGALAAVGASCYDAAVAGGSWVALLMAGVMTAAAFWKARRDVSDGVPRVTE